MRFFLREAGFQDVSGLRELARLFPLCSLPEKPALIEGKIQASRDSFRRKLPKEKRVFLFVLEDRASKKIAGSSQILSSYEKASHPFFVIETAAGRQADSPAGGALSRRGQKRPHGGRLRLTESAEGRHQLGGLILRPGSRSSPERLGFQLSALRLLYIGAFQEEFSPVLEVSLTAPFEREGGRLRSAFYEEAARPFVNKSYEEAIRLLRLSDRRFFSHFPKRLEIPLNSLSPKARKALSAAHGETASAFRGLLKMGFKETLRRHCLDGGIYLEARVSEIPLLQKVRQASFQKPEEGFWEEPAHLSARPCLWGQPKSLAGGFAGGIAEGVLRGGVFCLKQQPPLLNLQEKGFIAPLLGIF